MAAGTAAAEDRAVEGAREIGGRWFWFGFGRAAPAGRPPWDVDEPTRLSMREARIRGERARRGAARARRGR